MVAERTNNAKPNSFELIPVMKYIEALTNKYPEPISHQQLAKLSGVSLAAISKVKTRLYPLCDTNTLAFRRRLLLRNDADTVARIGAAFYFSNKFGQFLQGAYGQKIWMTWVLNAHEKLGKAIPEYSKFFGQQDAIFSVGLMIRGIGDSLAHVKHVKVNALDPDNVLSLIIVDAIEIMQKLGPNMSRYLVEEASLEHILELRDRLWYMTHQFLTARLEGFLSVILSALPNDATRENYLCVYRHTLTFYIDTLVFNFVTETIKKAADDVGVPWKGHYSTLGSMYSPGKTIDSLQSPLDQKSQERNRSRLSPLRVVSGYDGVEYGPS